jgi:hypothetical protein
MLCKPAFVCWKKEIYYLSIYLSINGGEGRVGVVERVGVIGSQGVTGRI